MKRSKYRIALLVGSVVMITLLLFILIFNMVSRHNIKTEAESAIKSALKDADIISDTDIMDFISSLSSEQSFETALKNLVNSIENISLNSILDIDPSEDDSLYSANVILLSSRDNKIVETINMLSSLNYADLISWCKQNDTTELIKKEIKGKTFYIQSKINDSKDEILAFVDVTGEYDMINRINITFFIAAVIICISGSFAGYLLGRKLDQTQLIQKQFFENTSHELKTPLTTIRGYAEGIEKGVITDYQRTGRVINAQVEHMSTLVEGILSIAKLESGAIHLNKEDFSVPDFIQDCLMPFEGIAKSRSLNVELYLAPGTVNADPSQLEHAITNLLTNAFKYALSTIKIIYQPGELIIWNDIMDISDEELCHIFDRFYTGKNGNTGIGLALAKEIIELHGKTISAVKENGGLSFRISL
ncbi:MAG: HAMP domain-containing histidine kinase [Eubacterium sp.]|nr:HAMP domain-containing histidine kinase [Eubacterium sp.]